MKLSKSILSAVANLPSTYIQRMSEYTMHSNRLNCIRMLSTCRAARRGYRDSADWSRDRLLNVTHSQKGTRRILALKRIQQTILGVVKTMLESVDMMAVTALPRTHCPDMQCRFSDPAENCREWN